jgi:hypothetical protein
MTVWTDVGNIQKFGITPNPTVIKHKKTRGGLKTIDKVATTLVEFGFEASLDEWTLDNLKMALLGQTATDTGGDYVKIGIEPVERQLKFVGDGKFGGRYEVILPRVFINAKAVIEFMSEGDSEFSKLPLSGDVLNDATLGAFGTVRALAGATGSAPVNTPDELNYYIGTGILYSAPVA